MEKLQQLNDEEPTCSLRNIIKTHCPGVSPAHFWWLDSDGTISKTFQGNEYTFYPGKNYRMPIYPQERMQVSAPPGRPRGSLARNRNNASDPIGRRAAHPKRSPEHPTPQLNRPSQPPLPRDQRTTKDDSMRALEDLFAQAKKELDEMR